MGKSDPDTSAAPRKRKLNVIYFVDSARTRSFAVPLSRLNVMLFGALALMTWSVASAFLILWLSHDKEQIAERLRTSLATVFEYESRHDDVYNIAYPPAGKAASTTLAAKAVPAPSTPAAPAVTPPPAPVVSDSKAEVAGQTKPDAAKAEETDQSSVVVSNPVLAAGAAALDLQFDLTNKSDAERVEGFIWAVAEFKTDQGETLFIGAPAEIGVQADGEPEHPTKSALFNIRRFKKKGFSFPFIKNKPGMFTGVKIGVTDRSGANKTTYKVPVEIRVGKRSAKDGGGSSSSEDSQSG